MSRFRIFYLFLLVFIIAGCTQSVSDFINDDINTPVAPAPVEPGNEEFCGVSTEGFCNIASDCIKGGCSSQICGSRFEEQMTTTCEWRECYSAQDYSLICDCVNQQCKWHK